MILEYSQPVWRLIEEARNRFPRTFVYATGGWSDETVAVVIAVANPTPEQAAHVEALNEIASELPTDCIVRFARTGERPPGAGHWGSCIGQV